LQNSGRNSRKTDGVTIPPDYIGRFAPSPTGPLHLGSLYAALASYLQARSKNGKWLLRIDDLDSFRNVPGASDSILKTLEAFGLLWDYETVYQSQQIELYLSAIEQLQQQQLLYPCSCTRKDLVRHHQQSSGPAVYPGFCKDKTISENQPHSLRIKTENIDISFTDQLQGDIFENLQRVHGDFILKRKDQIIAYQLAVVVDDYYQHITEVVRGIDLLDSTIKQLYLQQKLGLKQPRYFHIPVIVDQQGCKLSKQTFAAAVDPKTAGLTLHKLLILLNQSPPAELNKAPVLHQLDWAIENWNPDSLKKIRAIRQ
jgi:glutamyl-Q tRNA(Asp) synthetase